MRLNAKLFKVLENNVQLEVNVASGGRLKVVSVLGRVDKGLLS